MSERFYNNRRILVELREALLVERGCIVLLLAITVIYFIATLLVMFVVTMAIFLLES